MVYENKHLFIFIFFIKISILLFNLVSEVDKHAEHAVYGKQVFALFEIIEELGYEKRVQQIVHGVGRKTLV